MAWLVCDIHESFDITGSKLVVTVTDSGTNFIKAFAQFGVDGNIIIIEPAAENEGSQAEAVEDEAGLEEMAQEADSEGEEEALAAVDMGFWVSSEEAPAAWLPSHVRCAVHRLALCATTDLTTELKLRPALKAFHEAVLQKCNDLWLRCRRPKSAEIIKDVIGKCLQRPVATRWNTLFDSLVAIERHGTRFFALVAIEDHYPTLRVRLNLKEVLTTSDMTYIKEYLTCSEPIAVAIDKLQGEETSFYGVVLPTLLVLRKQLRKLAAETRLKYYQPIVEGFTRHVNLRFVEELDVRTVVQNRFLGGHWRKTFATSFFLLRF